MRDKDNELVDTIPNPSIIIYDGKYKKEVSSWANAQDLQYTVLLSNKADNHPLLIINDKFVFIPDKDIFKRFAKLVKVSNKNIEDFCQNCNHLSIFSVNFAKPQILVNDQLLD